MMKIKIELLLLTLTLLFNNRCYAWVSPKVRHEQGEDGKIGIHAYDILKLKNSALDITIEGSHSWGGMYKDSDSLNMNFYVTMKFNSLFVAAGFYNMGVLFELAPPDYEAPHPSGFNERLYFKYSRKPL